VSPWKFVRRLTPAPSPTPSSRRTFPWRRLCRDLDRARTSLHAIALRLLRTALDDSPIRCRSSPVGLRHFYFYRPEFPKAQPLLAYEYWWTGEDSNLRSPQGAADLQSAGFSHSPTRPRKIHRPRQVQVRQTFVRNRSGQQAKTQNGLVSKDTSPSILFLRIRSASFPRKLTGGAGGGN
jgi:hypothetical protein